MTRPTALLRHALATAVVLSAVATSRGYAAVNLGEVHLAEFNCIACHEAGEAVKARLASRQSPKLGADGVSVSPQWLREFLADPQSVKPGTLMPDALHGLPAGERANAAEALTHYLVSLYRTDATAPGFSHALSGQGRDLFHRVGCVACHAPQQAPPSHEDEAAPKPDFAALARDSVPLGNLARKYTVAELAAFLRNPLKSRPSGRMPSLRLTDTEARAIAMYLLREQAGTNPPATPAVSFTLYLEKDSEVKKVADIAKMHPAHPGAADSFTLKEGQPYKTFALDFVSVLIAPTDGEYRFWTESDDGSELSIDDKLIVENDGIHPLRERQGRVRLTAGEHSLRVRYFNKDGERELKVSWAGPDFEKREIPATALSPSSDSRPMRPLGGENFTPELAKIARGRELFTSLNCAACHQLDQPGRKAKPLQELTSAGGCLAPNPPASAPRFSFTEVQRKELETALANVASLSSPRSPADHVAHTFTALNCFACHQRAGRGGPDVARRAYFNTTTNVDLGDEGTIPPHLNGAGTKLKPQWLERVLWQGATVRPYMATRMPQFGEANVRSLVKALAEADVPATTTEPSAEGMIGKHGQRLVGAGGLSCISCHVFAGKPSLGVPALDLTTTHERLRWDWFHRYLLDPASLRPGTRMPPFWPGGVAVNTNILGGDTEKQIAALWTYLADGKQAALPPGLIQARLELVPETEPLVYRHWIRDAGPRAIAVGYSEKVNLAFDAGEVRLALIWQGGFLDASRHRSGRGDGFGSPLGSNVRSLAPGVPFAVLHSPDAPWPADKSAAGKFLGYTYDAKRRPAFRYRYGNVEVEDHPVPQNFADNPDAGLRRELTLRSARAVEGLFFRAAMGRIEEKGGTFIVDGKVRLTFPGAQAVLRGRGEQSELLVPVVFKGGAAIVVEEISW